MENMTVEQALEAAKGLTFEKVWLALMESRQQLHESQQRMEKANEESRLRMEKANEESRLREEKANEESRLRMDKVNEESRLRMENSMDDFKKEMNKVIGKLGNSLGQLTESMFSADLWEKFRDYGIPVSMQSVRHEFNEDKRNLAEADIYIQNGEYAIPVEVKTNLSIEDVNEHLERINVIRKYLDEHNDRRKLMGAVAGATVPENVMRYAWKKGLFVLVPSGESVTIADVPENFKAREWSPSEPSSNV